MAKMENKAGMTFELYEMARALDDRGHCILADNMRLLEQYSHEQRFRQIVMDRIREIERANRQSVRPH